MDPVTPGATSELTPKGEISDRLIRSLQHLALIPDERLTADLESHDRAWSYGADFAGRWIEVMSLASAIRFLSPFVRDVRSPVASLITYQREDGMLGYRNDSTTWACAGRGLLGLVEAYVATGFAPAIQAARRLVRCFDASFPTRPTQRACMGLRDLVRYSEVTGDDIGIDVARRMYETSFELGPDAPFDSVFGNFHVFINIHRGLISLSRATGAVEYLNRAESLRRWTSEKHEWPSGGVPEWLAPPAHDDSRYAGNEDALFFSPVAEPALVRDETCTTGDWMLLNLELGAAGGDRRLYEHAEWIFWNHFLSGQAVDGGWCGHGNCHGMAGEVWDFCCSHHGPRCLIETLRYAIVDYRDGLLIGLYAPVERRFSIPGGSGSLELDFDPSRTRFTLRFGPETGGSFPVYVRKSDWTESMVVASKHRIIDESNDTVTIAGSWSGGDTIELSARPRIELVSTSDPAGSDTYSIRYGTLMPVGVRPSENHDSETSDRLSVTVTWKSTGSEWRADVELGRCFSLAVGLYWVDSTYTFWDDPERGFRFVFEGDGEVIAGSNDTSVQGYQGTQVAGFALDGVDILTIAVSPTDGELPIEGAHYETLTLFDGRGNAVPIMLEIVGPATGSEVFRAVDWSVDESAVMNELKTRQNLGVSWPLAPDPNGPYLVPFKDLPRQPVAETIIGERGAIESLDFTLGFRRR